MNPEPAGRCRSDVIELKQARRTARAEHSGMRNDCAYLARLRGRMRPPREVLRGMVHALRPLQSLDERSRQGAAQNVRIRPEASWTGRSVTV